MLHAIFLTLALSAPPLAQEANTWVKRSPLPGGPPSPRLGYESTWGYDPIAKLLIRWSGHNQGGGGEQNAETWTFDPLTARWTLKEPNDAPPGVCCGQQNVFDPLRNRFVRFSSFSGSHGWQWSREIYLKNSSVWTYDLASNTWRDMRPVPDVRTSPLRCASWDSDHEVIVVFGGEGNSEGTVVYDPHTNTWTRRQTPDRPAFRSGGNLAYDQAHKLHVLFGAQFTDDPHTWAYDYRTNRWLDLKPKTMPPTDRNDAVLTYDSRNQVIIALVKISEGKGEAVKHRLETWTFDVGKNTWTRMNPKREPDASGNRARLLTYLPDHGLAILETRTHRPHGPDEQQIWTYCYAPAAAAPVAKPTEEVKPPSRRRRPPLVEDVAAVVKSAKEVVLSWPAVAGAAGYLVERAPVEVWSEDQLVRLKKRTPPLPSPSVGALKRIGAFQRLTEKPLVKLGLVDCLDLERPMPIKGPAAWENRLGRDHLDPDGKPYQWAVYAYRVLAVDAAGKESGPSPYVLTIPAAVQYVFARERGTTCDLKWQPLPGAAGYRVYRMDGRFDNAAISRLAPQPIAQSSFADDQAGKTTRRYYVVAVDVIGQEGIPSAPVWFEREWKPFYKPFVGEWHQ